MSDLTVQILVKNNEKVIQRTLNSIFALKPLILVGDLGCSDNTLNICRQFDATIVKADGVDRGKTRNGLLRDGWQMYVEPGEVLAYGDIKLQDLIKDHGYYFQVFRGNIITKEIRLWHSSSGLSFKNPVYECVVDNKATDLNVVIYSQTSMNSQDRMEAIRKWKQNYPAASEPYYYEACLYLSQGKYDEFLKAAHNYLFRDNSKPMPITMTRYYCAMTYCHMMHDAPNAIKFILPCLVAKPLMAEFWCVLGDIYYALLKKYDKAKDFYDNAIELGSMRLKTDNWPLEVNKYKEYPEEMKAKCVKIMEQTTYFGSKK